MSKQRKKRQLPDWVQAKGIFTQKQLILSLLPYLRWQSKQQLMRRFLLVLPHAATQPNKSFTLDRHIIDLVRMGLIEKKLGDFPPKPRSSPNARPHRYVYYRRVTRKDYLLMSKG